MRRKRLYEEADEELREEMPTVRRGHFPALSPYSEREEFISRLREQVETRGVIQGTKECYL